MFWVCVCSLRYTAYNIACHLYYGRKYYYMFWVCVFCLRYTAYNIACDLCYSREHYYMFWVCVCSFVYPAYNIACHLCYSRKSIIVKGGRCVRLTTYHHPVPLSRNLGTLTSWNPLSRPVTELINLYLYLHINHPLFLSIFFLICLFWTHFRKIFEYQISWKPFQRKHSRSMRTDRLTDRRTSRVSQFCEYL